MHAAWIKDNYSWELEGEEVYLLSKVVVCYMGIERKHILVDYNIHVLSGWKEKTNTFSTHKYSTYIYVIGNVCKIPNKFTF